MIRSLTIILTIVVGYSFLLLFIFPFVLPADSAESLAKIFQLVGAGFGAIMAGLGGFNFIADYIRRTSEEEERLRKIVLYQRIYPVTSHGETFEIIQPESRKGTLYVLEKDAGVVHHIGNIQTYHDLKFTAIPTKTVKDEEFDKYTLRETILTRGTPGL